MYPRYINNVLTTPVQCTVHNNSCTSIYSTASVDTDRYRSCGKANVPRSHALTLTRREGIGRRGGARGGAAGWLASSRALGGGEQHRAMAPCPKTACMVALVLALVSGRARSQTQWTTAAEARAGIEALVRAHAAGIQSQYDVISADGEGTPNCPALDMCQASSPAWSVSNAYQDTQFLTEEGSCVNIDLDLSGRIIPAVTGRKTSGRRPERMQTAAHRLPSPGLGR